MCNYILMNESTRSNTMNIIKEWTWIKNREINSIVIDSTKIKFYEHHQENIWLLKHVSGLNPKCSLYLESYYNIVCKYLSTKNIHILTKTIFKPSSSSNSSKKTLSKSQKYFRLNYNRLWFIANWLWSVFGSLIYYGYGIIDYGLSIINFRSDLNENFLNFLCIIDYSLAIRHYEAILGLLQTFFYESYWLLYSIFIPRLIDFIRDTYFFWICMWRIKLILIWFW